MIKDPQDAPIQLIRPPGEPTTICSRTLLGERKLLFIIHEGERYQLRITKLRKLILTK